MALSKFESPQSLRDKATEFRKKFSKTTKKSLDDTQGSKEHDGKVDNPKEVLNRALQNLHDPFLADKFFEFLHHTGKSN